MLNYPPIPRTSRVSLVAFYGAKPPQLIALIQKLQDYLSQSKSIRKFTPYKIEQVHGTIIGCEGFRTEAGIVSKWFHQYKQANVGIDLSGMLDYLHHKIDLPLTIRFGGYDRRVDYNFLSRDRHPYFRSFQLQPKTSAIVPVLIGWTWNDGVSSTISQLRHDLEKFNLLHKYHLEPDAVDNDFYLRLGTIDAGLSFKDMKAIATEIRHLLEVAPPWYISLNLDNLAFARYQERSLTPATTETIPLSEITVSQIEDFYRLLN